MNTNNLSNPIVKKAIDALQSGDKQTWFTLFTDNVHFTDDGNRIDFRSFFEKAIGHEKFLSLDEVTNNGKDLSGDFQAGQWGTFKVFFKFGINTNGKIDTLHIGQVH